MSSCTLVPLGTWISKEGRDAMGAPDVPSAVMEDAKKGGTK